MPDALIREFQRRDRDQATMLANAHLAAILPGLSISVNTLLSQLEREPDEYVVDPWVIQRVTLVAEDRGNVLAAAHLVRYGSDPHVGADYQGAAEIRWLLCWPGADAVAAGERLLGACLGQFRRWRARREFANGALPAPGAYGVPDAWPHVHQMLADAGFGDGRPEEVLAAAVSNLPRAVPPPRPGLRVVRSVGAVGTRFAAREGDRDLGYLDIDTALGEQGRFAPGQRLADIGNLWVEPDDRRRGVARWLLATAADWLDLAGVRLLLTYLDPMTDDAERAFVTAAGFTPMITTTRGLQRRTSPGQTLARPG